MNIRPADMTAIMKGIAKWGPIIILLICTLLFQDSSGKPRMRHSHRKLRCSKCPPGWGVSQACTPLADTQCTHCAHGRYSPHHSYRNPCWICSRCGAGLFEAHPCRSDIDTVCDTCHRPTIRARDLSADYYGKCDTGWNATGPNDLPNTRTKNKKK